MVLLKKNIYALPNSNLYSLPLGIEYEKLERTLINRKDLRSNTIQPALTPGVSNKINNQAQSMINFDEPNTKPAYPQPTIPYSQGLVWE